MEFPRSWNRLSGTSRPRLWSALLVFLLVWAGFCQGDEPSGDLRREIWIRFDGSGLWVEDRINCGSRDVDRFSVEAPWRLESVHHAGHPVVLTSLDSTERGFPVGGNAHLWVSSSLEGRTWRTAPYFPVGWEYESIEVNVHHGPGWKLLAVFGAGEGKGSWLDSWTFHYALSLLGLGFLAGMTVGWRIAILLVAGLVLAGGEEGLWPMILYYASLVAAGAAGLVPQGPKRRLHQWVILGHVVFAWAVWCGVYSGSVIGSQVDPSQKMSESFRSNRFIDTTDDQKSVGAWPRSIRIESSERTRLVRDPFGISMEVPDTIDTLVDVEYGEDGDWGKRRPDYPMAKGGVLGGIPPDGGNWKPEDDFLIEDGAEREYGPAPLGVLESHWLETAASYSWNSDSAHPTFPGRMRLIALPPAMALVWRLLSVACLWIALAGAVRKVWKEIRGESLGIPSGMHVVVLALFCIASQADASEAGMEAQIVRELRFSHEPEMVTRIEALKGSDTVLRISLMPGEIPLDSMQVLEGKVIVRIERLEGIPGDSVWECSRVRCDSLRSGAWRGRYIGNGYGSSGAEPTWRSRFERSDSILLRGEKIPGIPARWMVFHSPRWAPRFEGSVPREHAFGNPRSITFHPTSTDSLRILPRPTLRTEVVRTFLSQARWKLADSSRSRTTLDLRLVVAAPDTLRVGLPEGAVGVDVLRNRRRMPASMDPSGRYAVPLTPGTCAVRLSWRAALPAGIVRRAPILTLSVQGNDASVEIPVDSGRWVPALHGPGFGPPEGWVVGLVGWGLMAMGLLLRYRIGKAWPDLVVLWLAGSFVTPALALCFPLVVYLHRPRKERDVSLLGGAISEFSGWRASAVLLTPILVVMAWVALRLDSGPTPPSATDTLLWFTDVAGPEFMRPWMVVLPGWAWTMALGGSMAWLVSLGIRLVRRNAVHSNV